MIQLAPRGASTDDGTQSGAVRSLRDLAEFPPEGATVYVLRRTAEGGIASVPIEVDATRRFAFPFMKMAAHDPMAAPVFKRVRDAKGEVSPKRSTLHNSLRSFVQKADAETPEAPVFRAALAVLGDVPTEATARAAWVESAADALYEAIGRVPHQSGPATFVSLGDLPVADEGLASYLLATLWEKAKPTGAAPCPLCGEVAPLGAKGLATAKINFLNTDNHGFFPNFDEDRAAQRFAICQTCSNALRTTYLQLKDKLRVDVAGTRALLLPYLHGDATERAGRRAWDVVQKAHAGRGTHEEEGRLLDALAREGALASFHLLWATAGDSLEDVTGFVTDVPCTRLAKLSALHVEANQWSGGMLPIHRVCAFDLSLTLVGRVLTHPGRKRVQHTNNGQHLASLRRDLARAVYLGAPIDPQPLARELRAIIADWLVDPSLDERYIAREFTQEPTPKGNARSVVNAASWVRHAALLLRYLRHLEVLPAMSSEGLYSPRAERLQKLLAPPSGVASDAQMFALFLGVLFGRLLVIQAAKKVSVRANALTWLRRATLTGDELPGLYVKVREKLQEYEAERDPAVREVVVDLSELGRRLGTRISLDVDTTMYFLFLGQALAGEVFPKKPDAPTEAE